MTKSSYPYPRLEHDGYQLAVIDQDSDRVLATPLPSDDERFAAVAGDLVKLVFEYREPDIRKNGAVIGAEHMWVRVTEQRDNCLVGLLDSAPRHSKLLHEFDRISFHPRHIIAFWRESPTGEQDSASNGG